MDQKDSSPIDIRVPSVVLTPTGLVYGTVRNAVALAKRFDRSQRRNNPSRGQFRVSGTCCHGA